MPRKQQSAALIPLDRVQRRILLIRGMRAIIDADLAALYGVSTKRLNEQVKRNADRFPSDFMFQLTEEEAEALRSQFATLNMGTPDDSLRLQNAALNVKGSGESFWGGSQNAISKRGRHRKYLPYAFTEHGAIMAATILSSPQAVTASLFVVRAFVKLRELLSTHVQLAHKLEELERRLTDHDKRFAFVFDAIRQLMEPGEEDALPKPPIGFHTKVGAPRRNSLTRTKRN